MIVSSLVELDDLVSSYENMIKSRKLDNEIDYRRNIIFCFSAMRIYDYIPTFSGQWTLPCFKWNQTIPDLIFGVHTTFHIISHLFTYISERSVINILF